MKCRVFALILALLVGSFVVPSARAQTTGEQSNYIFRYNTGVSGVFLDTMTFASEQPINLGACTANEKINGPISCVVNCNSDSVCLLELSGPPGASVNDVMEKVSETPVAGASPRPTASTRLNSSAPMGSWFQVSRRNASYLESRIEAYNSADRQR